MIHPSKIYIGVKSKKSYGKPKEIFPFEIIVTDIDGNPISNSNIKINRTFTWTDTVEGKIKKIKNKK